jgi:hypothetical protein
MPASRKLPVLPARRVQRGARLAVFPEAFLPGYPRGITFGTVVGSLLNGSCSFPRRGTALIQTIRPRRNADGMFPSAVGGGGYESAGFGRVTSLAISRKCSTSGAGSSRGSASAISRVAFGPRNGL